MPALSAEPKELIQLEMQAESSSKEVIKDHMIGQTPNSNPDQSRPHANLLQVTW